MLCMQRCKRMINELIVYDVAFLFVFGLILWLINIVTELKNKQYQLEYEIKIMKRLKGVKE